MYLFENLNQIIQQYLSKEKIELLRKVFYIARDAHAGQIRLSGEPYITHPVAVACMLAQMRLDHETLMAALLHDVIEDTSATFQDIESLFGTTVAGLVEGVSKLDKLNFRNQKEAQAENFQKMIMAMVKDIRVILIKLADRTHNMRTLGSLRLDKRRRIAKETLEIYSPLAHRLGIHHIKTELEELGFEALYPNRYRVIKEVVKSARGNRKDIIRTILYDIDSRLTQSGVLCRVNGREKHLYSIYCKMYLKEQKFHSIMDIYAFRVIVQDVDTCYRVLGQMHNLYKPRPSRIKDYIAIPKANGYQSLHTSLIGPHGVPVEVQIRTEDMEQMAERGVAAHWAYKKQGETGTTAQVRAQRWMQSLLELQKSAGSSVEFIENVKSDLFPDEIYVFTPEGRIIELPIGATPVDFAYAVHTNIGHSCIGARVDRQPYLLSQVLISGQTIEIITAPWARPTADWLNFVVSSKARSKIRQLLKNLTLEDSINKGLHFLNNVCNACNKLTDAPKVNLDIALARIKLYSMNNLLEEVALGNAISIVVVYNLQNNSEVTMMENALIIQNHNNYFIKGSDVVFITFVKCCHSMPGDPIVAQINPGKGLIIHNESCRNIRGYQKEPDKFISVEWDNNHNADFVAGIQVGMIDDQGAVSYLTTLIHDANFNIQSMNIEKKDGCIYCAFIRFTTKNRDQLINIMHKIRIIPDVVYVIQHNH
ncbi:bifunctional GTP diphosphokinase/guanosine-3',5'-bis pyrophosphate 3'-pyrophosphohydrolase [Candidatus Hartigia pinicola]